MSNSQSPEVSALWIPKEDLEFLFLVSRQKSERADALLRDIHKDEKTYVPRLKLLLREVYCLIEGNLSFLEETLTANVHEKDGEEGYIIKESEVVSLTTYSVNLQKISMDLLSLNISLESQ